MGRITREQIAAQIKQLEKKAVACLAEAIFTEVYGDSDVHVSVVSAIEEWINDPDTERRANESVTSLADAWIEAAHRES